MTQQNWCACENLRHFDGSGAAHSYGMAVATTTVDTDWGTQRLCPYCLLHCHGPYQADLYVHAVHVLGSVMAPLHFGGER